MNQYLYLNDIEKAVTAPDTQYNTEASSEPQSTSYIILFGHNAW